MSSQLGVASNEDIKKQIIQIEQNCRLYRHKISNIKESLEVQNSEILQLNADCTNYDAEIILLEKQVINLKGLIKDKILIFENEQSKLDEFQNKVWLEREQFENKVAAWNQHPTDISVPTTMEDRTNEEAILEGEVMALKNYVLCGKASILVIQSDIDRMCADKEVLVKRCM